MYGNDFEHWFICYKVEVMPQGRPCKSIAILENRLCVEKMFLSNL